MSISDLPPLSPSADLPEIRDWAQRVDEWRRTREPAATGDENDKFLTRGEALDGDGFTVTVTQVITGSGSGGGGGTPDLSPPSSITGLAASSAIYHHLVEWDAPTYTAGGGNAYTEVYRAIYAGAGPLPTFASAVLVATATGPLNIIAIPAQPGEQAHFWVGAVTVAGIRQVDGAGPTGGTNGVQTTTGQDVEYLLGILSGRITASELFADLATPIERIGLNEDNAATAALQAMMAAHTEQVERAAALLRDAEDRGTAITQTRTLVQEGDAQLARDLTTISATVQTNQTTALAAVEQEAQARADAVSAEAVSRETLATQLRGAYTGTDLASVTTGLIASERDLRASQTSAAGSRLDALEVSVDTPSTGLLARTTTLESAVVDLDGDILAEASRIDALEVSVDTPSTGLLARATALETVTTNVTSGNAALASRASALETTVNNGTTGVAATAAALDVVETLVNHGTQGNVALASRTSTLEVSVTSPTIGNNPTYAALQTEASVRAGETGDLFAKYTVKIDLGGFMSGWGLASSSNDGSPVSDFYVMADTIAFVPSVNYSQESAPGSPTLNQRWYKPSTKEFKRWDGSTWVAFNTVPLTILTSPTTEGGVAVPAGVYIDAAFILNLTAQYAKIASLVADDITAADITAAQILAGSLRVGGYLQSTNYVAGVSGWRITAAGVAEFQSGEFRGAVYASSGTFSGSLSAATGTFAGDLSAAGGTFAGALSAATGTFAGSLSAATGTFSGSLSAASGTFAGTLTAGAINAVDTINLRGESISANYLTTIAEITKSSGGTNQLQVLGTDGLQSSLVAFTQGALETFVVVNAHSKLGTTNARWLDVEITPFLVNSGGTIITTGFASKIRVYAIPTAATQQFFGGAHSEVFSGMAAGSYRVRFTVSVTCRAGDDSLQNNLTELAVTARILLINRKV